MRKKAKNWLVGGAAALFIIFAVFGLLLLTISDLNRARPWINKSVSVALDRPFAINGDLRLHWVRDVEPLHYRFPRPQISASDIVIGNPSWTKGKQLGEIKRVTAVLDPLPLLRRTAVLPLLDIDRAKILLERREDGRNNWTFGKDEPELDPKKRWRIAPGLLRIHRSQIQLDDIARQLSIRAEADSYAEGILWSLKGTLNKAPLSGHGMAGSLLALQDKKTPYPIAFELTAGDTHIEAKGTLTNPSQLAALDVNLKIAGTSMAQLYALTNILLPETPPFSTDGHLVGELDTYGGTWRYEKFNGKVGNSDLHGTLVYQAREQRPLVSAKLTSDNLHFADLAPLIGADSNASKERRNASVRQPEDKVLPVEPFKTDRWNSIDAVVEFTGKKIIRGESLPIENLHAALELKNAVLQLKPLRFGVAGGELAARIKVDGNKQPANAEIDMTSKGLQLKELFPTSESMQPSLGHVNGSAELIATGNSIAELAGSSTGELRLFMDRATVSKFLLEAAGLNIANVVATKLFGDRQVTLNCAAADFNVDKGLMQTEGFVIDTEEATIDIGGNVHLGEEKLDLKIKPETKGLRILSLRTPLYVKGSFKNPDVNLDKGVLALRGGGAVALGAVALPAALIPLIATGNAELAPDNGCVTLLANSRAAGGKTTEKVEKSSQPIP